MSYSFSIKVETKALAKQAVASKFDEITASQPIHALDRIAVLLNASTVIDLLADDDSKDIAVTCNGFLSTRGDSADLDAVKVGTAAVSCQASHVTRA